MNNPFKSFLLAAATLVGMAQAQVQHNCRLSGNYDPMIINGQPMIAIVGCGDIATFIDPKVMPGALRIRLRAVNAAAFDTRQCPLGASVPWFHDESMDVFSATLSMPLNQAVALDVPMQFNPLTGMTTTWRLDYCAIPSSSPCNYGAPTLTGVLVVVETY